MKTRHNLKCQGVGVRLVKALSIGLLAVLLSVASQDAAVAQSACKGLEKAACDGNSSCSWVSAYETKTGKQVKAHCRSKSSKSTSTKKN